MKHLIAPATLALAACAHNPTPFPPVSDVNALVVPRPKMPPEALTDPTADANHRSAVRKWGDDLSAAGKRVCKFLDRTGMPGLECGD